MAVMKAEKNHTFEASLRFQGPNVEDVAVEAVESHHSMPGVEY